jgi:two-component system, chemotaxis family, CheB/CheR fusion protein
MAKKKPGPRKKSVKKPAPAKVEKAPPQSAARRTGKRSSRAESFPIVGIGASAGGLEATVRFFEAMPPDAGMAFVVVQHLDPEKPSLTAELLGKRTAMIVREAENGVRVEPDCVYVIPPNCYLSIEGGVLHLSRPDPSRGSRAAIDFFLRSLANDQGRCAIAMILSGSGGDGALGARAVKGAGGLTLAQAPETAQHDSMPRSAIATGMVDHVAPVEEMPELLIGYARHPYVNGRTAEIEEDAGGEPADLGAILALLRTRTKKDFRKYKKKTLARRLARRMSLHHMEAPAQYLAYLRENEGECRALVKDLLISVTDFFREPEAWEELSKRVIVPLVKERAPDEPIRVWIPACATGEEAYTMAMLFMEALQEARKNSPLQIFATDVDPDALMFARRGRYPASIAADISPERLQRFFTEQKADHGYEVNKALREAVTFAEQNLISDPPFSHLDLISCRNVMIYLEPDVQEKIIALFHFALSEGGYLLLGNAESIGRQQDLFRPVSQKWRIFRRIGATQHERVEFPVVPGASTPRSYEPARPVAPRRETRLTHLAQQRLLDQFAPASVLVDRSFEIVLFCGATDEFLTQPSGAPTASLLDRAREGLRAKLRGAIHTAIQENRTVVVDAHMRRDGKLRPVRLTVLPINDPQGEDRLALVVFESKSDPAAAVPQARSQHPETAPDLDDETIVRHLERELLSTREDLQATIEQLETSNEELKAANEEVMSINEELQSTNEELETSKEELQSLNEELSTVNSQLATKVEELETSNDDLNNLLSSTDIGTVCLDRSFRIRWFTPAVKDLVSLMPGDIGRPLKDFAARFVCDDLLKDAAAVLDKLSPVEREIGTREGRWFLSRVLPYRTADDRIDGVVLTFTDITLRKQAEQDLQRLNETLEQRVRERTELLRMVRDVAVAANEAESIEQALQFTLERVCRFNGWRLGHVFRVAEDGSGDAVPTSHWYADPSDDFQQFIEAAEQMRLGRGKGFVQQVLASGRPCWAADLRKEPSWRRAAEAGVRTAVGFPVLANRTPIAVLAFFSPEAIAPEERVSEALESIGIQLGHLIERKELEKEVAEATAREQRRIGLELHDNVGQQISGLAMMVASLARSLDQSGQSEAGQARLLLDEAEKVKTNIRHLIKGVMPIEVEGEGLMAALAELADSACNLHAVACKFECPEPVLVKDSFTATNLYLIAQEAVHNAVKHSHGGHIVIRLTNGEGARLTVMDDGEGFRGKTPPTGQGMRIMRYRAGLIGAALSVAETAQGGVAVTCTAAQKEVA